MPVRLRKIINVFCLLTFFPSVIIAQVNDAGLWVGINVEKRITKKFTASLSEEIRFNENVSELGTAFTEAGVDYKVIKNLTAGVAYRFIQKRRVDDFYSLRHRAIASLTYKIKIKKFELSIKERYQLQYADINTSEDGKIPERYLRSKLTIKYSTGKKYTPFISSELFYQLSNPDGNEFDNVRYVAGFEYKINKFHSVDFFYMINCEFNINNPWTEYITGISYAYTFWY